jgi:ribosome-interacting GTPase 1
MIYSFLIDFKSATVPTVILYEVTKIQLLSVPNVFEDIKDEKHHNKQVIASVYFLMS